MRRLATVALGLFFASVTASVTMVSIIAYHTDSFVTLESTSVLLPRVAASLVAGTDNTPYAFAADTRQLIELRSGVASTSGLSFEIVGQPDVVRVDYRKRIIAITNGSSAHVLAPTGMELRQFTVPKTASMAVLSSGDIALASSTRQSRIQLYSNRGMRLAEFGAPRQIEPSDHLQNQFLNSGLVLPGPADTLFFLFNRTPDASVEQWTRNGRLLRQFSIEGAAITRQREAIIDYSMRRPRGETGGLATVTAASFDSSSGHLWVGTTAGTPDMPNVYEYDRDGNKLGEYRLHHDSGFIPFVTDILVRRGTLYAIANDSVYTFRLPAAVRAAEALDSGRTLRLVGAMQQVLGASLLPRVFAQYSCGPTDTDWSCTRSCSVTNVNMDCKSPTWWGEDPVVSHSCNTANNKCTLSVTTCSTSTGNVNHGPVEKSCPKDDDYDGYEDGYDCNDNDAQIHPGAAILCYENQDWDCNTIDDYVQCNTASPILIDMLGDGFSLTDVVSGVTFDLDADGVAERLSWTAFGSDDAWLALDRNHNGTIDNGSELFGNFTPQPPSSDRNGFMALALFDRPENGGNDDGVISADDVVWGSLLLWRDKNHDGKSQAEELIPIASSGLSSIELDYKESRRTDRFGNQFRLRAKLHDQDGVHTGRWVVDVYLVRVH